MISIDLLAPPGPYLLWVNALICLVRATDSILTPSLLYLVRFHDMSCPQCLEGFVLPGTATGSIQGDFSGAYLAPSPTSASTSNDAPRRAVVLLTDAFGLGIENPKIIADELAQRLECDV